MQHEILHVKLGISTKFYLQNIIQTHIFNILSVPGLLPIGACIASYHLLCCILETDLSAELPLRSQYQCCFHNCAKSAYYYMSLYIKSVISDLLRNLLKM